MPFVKGQPRPVGSGRARGTPNKATRAVREFLAEVCDDVGMQRLAAKAIRDRARKGDVTGFFKAVDKMIPDPPRELSVDLRNLKMIEWPVTIATDEDRK